MLFYAAAVLGFVIGLPGELAFWAVDSLEMLAHPTICQQADQTLGDYLVKGHWTEAPWRQLTEPPPISTPKA
jgi:hypothetical protein